VGFGVVVMSSILSAHGTVGLMPVNHA